jgi:serine/threonine protein kinase/tetratricopeptide (TPR) repeat protein
MDDARWTLVKDLVGQAHAMAPGERASFLDEQCAGDAALQQEVESLIASIQDAPDLFSGAPPEPDAQDTDAAYEGYRVGAYKLTRRLGRGGMGAVFLAERCDGQFSHNVAVKLINRSIFDHSVVRRFLRERQTQANLRHPNIARLFDGGVTDDGTPYLMMEYIEGDPITTYCDEHHLTVSERLQLFSTVLSAVHHAHQNLVVHCDLKPSNVLVSADGTVKLLDFGISRVLRENTPSGGDDHTATMPRILTPGYASPEQIRGESITTSSDIYSLGVILYQLLTGQRPYQIDQGTPLQLERTVCETDPTRPSLAVIQARTRGERRTDPPTSVELEGIAAARRTSPHRLQRRLRGDLDNIILMAMRKEPERRYASVEQFGQDIRRHLQGLPVVARDDSIGYRFAKFAARHAVGVAAAVALAVALIGGIIGTTWQARIAARQRDAAMLAHQQAHAEALKAERVNVFLQDMLASARPELTRNPDITVREVLDEASAQLDTELAQEPQVTAALHTTIGQTYQSLGLYDEALPHLEEALRIHREDLGEEDADVVSCLNDLGTLQYLRGELEVAETLFRASLPLLINLYGEQHAQTAECLNNLGAVRRAVGDNDAAETLHRRALAVRTALWGEDHLAVAESLNNLASALIAKGDMQNAEPLMRRTLAIRSKHLRADHPDVAQGHNNLAVVLAKQGDFEGAASELSKAMDIYRRILQDDHPVLITTMGNLATLYTMTGRHSESERLLKDVLALQRAQLAEGHPSVAQTLWNLSGCYSAQGEYAKCEPLLRECLAIRRDRFSANDPRVAVAINELGRCLMRLGRYDEAETHLLESYELFESIKGPEAAETVEAIQWLADLYEAMGQMDRAGEFRSLNPKAR